MIEIDGSYGEGGGQILRTALSLSCQFKKPIKIFNIRANRKNPGLMPQHITCVKAAQLISGAEVKGDSIGSSELIFIPDKVQGGHYKFDIGTAGSTSLVLQTVLLPLCLSDNESEITITGGTHVPWSPPFHYLKEVFLPSLKNLGIDVSLDIERWGFYPKGGGIIKTSIKPINPAPYYERQSIMRSGVESITSLTLDKRGEIKSIKGLSAVCNLPLSIAERQKNSAVKLFKSHGLSADIEVISVPCIGQGTFIFLLCEFWKPYAETSTQSERETYFAGFSSLGQRGKKAEDVGKEAAEELIKFIQSNATIEKRLADQIVPYLSLSHENSSFTTEEITKHLLTNIWVVKKFLDIKIEVLGKQGEKGRVTILKILI